MKIITFRIERTKESMGPRVVTIGFGKDSRPYGPMSIGCTDVNWVYVLNFSVFTLLSVCSGLFSTLTERVFPFIVIVSVCILPLTTRAFFLPSVCYELFSSSIGFFAHFQVPLSVSVYEVNDFLFLWVETPRHREKEGNKSLKYKCPF